MSCQKCDSDFVTVGCPDGLPGCEVLHWGCPKCSTKSKEDPAPLSEDETLAQEKAARQARVLSRFQGKTVRALDCGACNTWTFHFTDGTSEKLWAEIAVNTSFGSIPGIFLGDEL